jgi:hypothetical protein
MGSVTVSMTLGLASVHAPPPPQSQYYKAWRPPVVVGGGTECLKFTERTNLASNASTRIGHSQPGPGEMEVMLPADLQFLY